MSFHLDYLLDLPGVKIETCTQTSGICDRSPAGTCLCRLYFAVVELSIADVEYSIQHFIQHGIEYKISSFISWPPYSDPCSGIPINAGEVAEALSAVCGD